MTPPIEAEHAAIGPATRGKLGVDASIVTPARHEKQGWLSMTLIIESDRDSVEFGCWHCFLVTQHKTVVRWNQIENHSQNQARRG